MEIAGGAALLRPYHCRTWVGDCMFECSPSNPNMLAFPSLRERSQYGATLSCSSPTCFPEWYSPKWSVPCLFLKCPGLLPNCLLEVAVLSGDASLCLSHSCILTVLLPSLPGFHLLCLPRGLQEADGAARAHGVPHWRDAL